MNSITFGIVAYHEERLIRRCLESIKDIADQIILVHDGPCTDRTLEIAREYTDQVYVQDRLGGSDPHRLFIIGQSKNDWLFMIDADEFLSDGLKYFLQHATLDPHFGAYSFKWPLWNGQRYVTRSNYRPCLFNLPKVWMIGLHNFSLQSSGPIKKVDEILHHQPEQNKVSFRRFRGQLKVRLERDARCYLQGFDRMPKYNEQLIPESFRQWFVHYLAHPGWYAYRNGIYYFLGSLRHLWRDGYYGFVISVQSGLYQYKLAQRIRQLKRERHS
ncbi:MAG TPA: glycosyltransferase family 2 protein [Candidatus Kapabacteria bacterium]|nr:glycosyltransferase family 2 protein [Candidatus Kapabacteria bacterium]